MHYLPFIAPVGLWICATLAHFFPEFYALSAISRIHFRYNSKTSASLIMDSGEIIREPKKIIRAQCNFYRKLYSEDKKIVFKSPKFKGPKLSNEERENLEKPITMDEMSKALSLMKNGKTPGSDRLSVDFYKSFYEEIKQPLFKCLCTGIENKQLHNSARRGIITLIPKARKDTRRLKNLRPISLLNVDLKVLEKIMANRMDQVIDKLIHIHQKGFMKARRISSNIRKVLDLIKLAKQDTGDDDGLIISVDFQKCFDQISFKAIFGALKYFGFGDKFSSIIQTIYSNFTACIQNNGNFSQPFEIKRGVRQGAPNLSYIFLLCAEMMAIMIRNNSKIEGLPVADMIYLLSQYADDFDTFSKPKKESITALFQTLSEFQGIYGFSINYDKTTIYRIGSIRHTNAKCYTKNEVTWANNTINILGVHITYNEREQMEINYTPLIHKARGILATWKRRKLSLMGKVQIVNTLVASLFVYKMTVLRRITNDKIKAIEDIILDFIWNGGKPKIAKSILYCPKLQGGLQLVNMA